MIYFDEYGDRNQETILLLHGAMAVQTFSQQYEKLKDFHLVVPHLPGAGESVEMTYNVKKMKEDLLILIRSLNKPQIKIIGHSIGAQLAIQLVTENPLLFSKAIFLSAWVVPNKKSINRYCYWAPIIVKTLRYKWIVKIQANYWHYTKEQSDYMVSYSSKMTVENYKQFFKSTMNINDYPQYLDLKIPMLAICGSRESKDIKTSLKLLSKNKFCNTLILPKAAHDFPMRCADRLNPIIASFFKSN